jgi:hypothetical protein
VHDGSQQGVRKLASDRRPDLRQLLGGAEPVEPRHQRCVQGCGDRQCRGRHQGGGPSCFILAFCLQHRLRHLFHEQGDSVRALDDVLPDVCREQLVADDLVDHGADFVGCQPTEGESGHVPLSDPARLEFWPEGYDQQHLKPTNPVHRPIKQFKAGGVRPMRILKDHQHCMGARQGVHLRDECVQRSFPLLLRGELDRGVASIIPQ